MKGIMRGEIASCAIDKENDGYWKLEILDDDSLDPRAVPQVKAFTGEGFPVAVYVSSETLRRGGFVSGERVAVVVGARVEATVRLVAKGRREFDRFKGKEREDGRVFASVKLHVEKITEEGMEIPAPAPAPATAPEPVAASAPAERSKK